MKRPSPSCLAALVIAAGALAFWYLCLIAPAWRHPFASNMGNVDFFTQIYPMSLRAAAWIRAGTFPLWNPYQFAGHPFHASALYGLCYPPNVIHLLLPTAAAIEAVVVVHLAMAGWFTWLYLRAIGLGPLARYAGAAVYMGCGFMASQAVWFTPAVASSTWLPLALLAVERIIARRAGRDAALLAVAVAFALLGGWTQFWLYTMYVVALYAGARLAVLGWRPATRPLVARVVVLLGLGVGLGLAATAVQLLPTRELQTLGPRRPGGLTVGQLIPFGSLAPDRLLTEALDWRKSDPFISPFYLGPIVVALIATSIFARRARVALIVMWTVFVASVLVSIALYTPFFEQVYLRLPAARWFRLPQRIAFLYGFAAAVLAAFGVDALASNGGTRRVPKIAVGLAMLGACAAFLFARPNKPGVELALVGAAMVTLTAAVVMRNDRVRGGLAALLVLLVVVDFARGSENVFRHPFHDLEVLHRQDAILDYIRAHQGLDRTYMQDAIGFDFSVMAKQGSLREIYSITDYEPLSLMRFSELYGLMSVPRPHAGPFTGFLNVDASTDRRELLQLLSVRYWVVALGNQSVLAKLDEPGSPWIRKPRVWSQGYALYERRAPLPRAYVATHAVAVADGAAGLAALTTPGFDPRTTVVVEPDVGLPLVASGSSALPAPIAPARITRYEPRDVVIEADAPARGYLVLTDTYFPGWQASVDGVAVPIYPGNHVVRAVPIEPGHHIVTFHYAPRSVLIGAWISAVVVLMILALAVIGRPPQPIT